MNVLHPKEVRERHVADTTYYVLGDTVRQVLISLLTALKTEPTPSNWNKHDDNALATMDQWLREERDFNTAQWSKFSKMLKKFEGIPYTLEGLMQEMGWEWGEPMDSADMFHVMEQRRENKRTQTVRAIRGARADRVACSKLFS